MTLLIFETTMLRNSDVPGVEHISAYKLLEALRETERKKLWTCPRVWVDKKFKTSGGILSGGHPV